MDNNTKEKNFISAVVYCYNDANLITDFIQGLHHTLAETFLKFEIIVVNDCSSDDSVEKVKQYAAHKEGLVISVINMSYFQGLENSMNAGINLAIGDFVYEFDSVVRDYDWSLLKLVYQKSLTGFDIVATRQNKKPRFASRLFYKIFNRYAHLQYEIGTDSFRLLSRRAINRIHSITQSIPFRKAAYANSGLDFWAISYTPVAKVPRKHRPDNMGIAVNSLVLFTDIAYRITVGLSLLMLCLSAGIAAYALVYKFFENPVEGWATTVIFLSLGFSGLFVILAMVLKYLQLLVRLNFKKKEFLFESIQKLQ